MKKEDMARPSGRAFVPAASSPQAVSTKGFDPGRFDGPRCGANFEPENGCQECWFCGRMLHAECDAYWEEE